MCVQGIHGWFQLLDEERGLTENSAVPATVTKTEHGECTGVVGVALCVCACVCVVCPTVDSSVVRKLAITLVRGAEGYGFSVSGFNPVSVTKVHPGQCQGEAPGGRNRPKQLHATRALHTCVSIMHACSTAVIAGV